MVSTARPSRGAAAAANSDLDCDSMLRTVAACRDRRDQGDGAQQQAAGDRREARQVHPPQPSRPGVGRAGAAGQGVGVARGGAFQAEQDDADGSDQNGRALQVAVGEHDRGGQGRRLDHRLDVIMGHLERAAEGHRFGEQLPQRPDSHAASQRSDQQTEHAADVRRRGPRAVQVGRVGEEVHDVRHVRRDAEQEDGGVAARHENQRRGDHRADGRTDLGPGPGEAVDLHLLVFASLVGEPVEDHRLVRPRAERLADAEQAHGGKQQRHVASQPQQDERRDVGEE